MGISPGILLWKERLQSEGEHVSWREISPSSNNFSQHFTRWDWSLDNDGLMNRWDHTLSRTVRGKKSLALHLLIRLTSGHQSRLEGISATLSFFEMCPHWINFPFLLSPIALILYINLLRMGYRAQLGTQVETPSLTVACEMVFTLTWLNILLWWVDANT